MYKIFFLIIFSEFFLNTTSFADTKYFYPQKDSKEIVLSENNSAKELDINETVDKEFGAPQFQGIFIKMLLSLTAIVILSIATVWALKRMGKSRLAMANSTKSIKIIEKRMISPKSAIYLIEYEGKKALVSESHLDMKIKIIE